MTRRVHDASVKAFGSRWKHDALKRFNKKSVTVEASLNNDHETELTVFHDGTTVCVITPKGRV